MGAEYVVIDEVVDGIDDDLACLLVLLVYKVGFMWTYAEDSLDVTVAGV